MNFSVSLLSNKSNSFRKMILVKIHNNKHLYYYFWNNSSEKSAFGVNWKQSEIAKTNNSKCLYKTKQLSEQDVYGKVFVNWKSCSS